MTADMLSIHAKFRVSLAGCLNGVLKTDFAALCSGIRIIPHGAKMCVQASIGHIINVNTNNEGNSRWHYDVSDVHALQVRVMSNN
jgi:hypothetical protein